MVKVGERLWSVLIEKCNNHLTHNILYVTLLQIANYLNVTLALF